MHEHDRLLILDPGSPHAQRIARRVRDEQVYSEVHPATRDAAWVRAWKPAGIILAGGPASPFDPELLSLGVPVLGIGSGMRWLARQLGGEAAGEGGGEYGREGLRVTRAEGLFEGFAPGDEVLVWGALGDPLAAPPPGHRVLASTATHPVAAFGDDRARLYGVHFHPEVALTDRGGEVLANFLFSICGCAPTWTAAAFIDESVARIRAQVGDEATVICGLSGGVDSAVAAALVHRAVGDRLTCILVDTGLLRKGERDGVERTFRQSMGIRLVVVDAADRFLSALAGVTDPEEKRKAIGRVFIEVFNRTAIDEGTGASFLVQGTVYPDVIESVSADGGSVKVKSHHNVGGLPDDVPFELVEPLRELFKDEVRRVGRALGLPEAFVGRHPFPGPGLGIRVLGEVRRDRLEIVREADAIYLEEIRRAGLYDEIWQAFAVLLPVRSVGVMGDARTYEHVVALRAVTSRDGMTADCYPLPHELLGRISNRIIHEVDGVNRVTYDVSSKPPATIEWE